MRAKTVLGTIGGTAPEQRVEVSLVARRGGGLTIDLCEQHFAEGIGWYDQRSFALDPQQFRQIQAMLGLSSRQLEQASQESPATLPFPGPSEVGEYSRPAVGDAV
ncbi:hypothetical protein EP7_001024 [Isosphaeraceae bacterium EP7]